MSKKLENWEIPDIILFQVSVFKRIKKLQTLIKSEKPSFPGLPSTHPKTYTPIHNNIIIL